VHVAVALRQALAWLCIEPFRLGQIAVLHDREVVASGSRQGRLVPVPQLDARVGAGVRQQVELRELGPQPALDRRERALLEVPDEGDSGVLLQHVVGEGNRVPVQERVDDVRPDPSQRVLPARAGNLLHVSERQGPDGIEAAAVGCPEAEEPMTSLDEGEHALRVVGELPHEQDRQPVLRPRRRRPLPEAPVELTLVQELALGRSEAERTLDLEVTAVDVDTASQRLTDQLVALQRMVDPLA